MLKKILYTESIFDVNLMEFFRIGAHTNSVPSMLRVQWQPEIQSYNNQHTDYYKQVYCERLKHQWRLDIEEIIEEIQV